MVISATKSLVTAYAEKAISGDILAGRLVRLACQRHIQDLEHGQERGLNFNEEAAQRAIDFFGFLKLAEGDHAGQPFQLQPWQQFIVGCLFGWQESGGSRRFRKAYIEVGKGNGKAIALDTPIPTPTGWTTMEAIEVGDWVFDEHGQPCRVLVASEVATGHDCYEVVFDDGNRIVADAEHLWYTEMRVAGSKADPGASKRGVPKSDWGHWRKGIRTTKEIASTLRYANGEYQSANHSVPLVRPLALPDVVLPIDPYVLGCWLGDGDSDGARLTKAYSDVQVLDEIQACGVAVTGPHVVAGRSPRWGLGGLDLRGLGLLNNKHIPAVYLRGSKVQRLALLQGLMDTDGYIAPLSGECEFTTTQEVLATGAAELLISLGMKAVSHLGRATLYGKDYGPKWRILFYPSPETPVFRLARKAVCQYQRHARRRLSGDRRIVECRPVLSVPVKCIGVGSPTHLYLAGRGMVPTHNTPMAAAIGLYGLVADGEAGAEIYTAGVTRAQANYLLRDADRMVTASPALRKLVKQSLSDQRPHLSVTATNSRMEAVSSEARTLDQKRVHIALIDEIHEHRTDEVVDKLTKGMKGRRQPLIVEITNSGYDRTSVCWQEHEYSIKILEGSLHNDEWFAYVCNLDPCLACAAEGKQQPVDGCDECDDWRDETVWPKANPNLDISISRRYLRGEVETATGMPAKENITKRLNFCIWTEQVTRLIPMDAWDDQPAQTPLAELAGRPCFAGLDLSSKLDFTALVLVFPDGEGGYDVVPYFWLPETKIREYTRQGVPCELWAQQGYIEQIPGEMIDQRTIKQRLIELGKTHRVVEIPYDPWNAAYLEVELADVGAPLVTVSQNFQNLSAPTKEMLALLKVRKWRHGSNPVLRWMASNAAALEDSNGNIRPHKGKSGGKIDGISAALNALNRAMVQGDGGGWSFGAV